MSKIEFDLIRIREKGAAIVLIRSLSQTSSKSTVTTSPFLLTFPG